MTKTNIIFGIVIIFLIVLTWYSIRKLNKNPKDTTTKSSFKFGGILNSEPQKTEPEPINEKVQEPKIRTSITAGEFVSAIREKLNKQNIQKINLQFTE